MKEIDKKYRKIPIENSELPYVSFSLVGNFSFLMVCFFIIFIISLITPFLPPIHSSYDFKWRLPTSVEDYFSQVKYGLLLGFAVFVIVLLSNFIKNIHTFIDRQLGFKKVAVFEVVKVWDLLTRKIVFFNNFHFVSLTKKDVVFDNIEVGQIAEVERTATQKFLAIKL